MPGIEVVRQSLELSPVPMLVVSESGEIVLANRQLDSLFDYDHGALIGQPVEILVPPEHRKDHARFVGAFRRLPVARAMGGGRVLMGFGRTAELLPLELSLEVVNIDGTPHTLMVAVDLRVQMQHQKKMELAMEAAASAMIMTDETGIIVLTNRAASDLFGYEKDELLGQSVDVLVPQGQRPEHSVFRLNFSHLPKSRGMAKGRPVYGCRKDGEAVPLEIALTPVQSPQGPMIMSTILDLTERLRAEAEIRQKNAELSELNKNLTVLNDELSQFTYSVSHDLKAPLLSMLGLLQIAREDEVNGHPDDVLKTIDQAIALCRRHGGKIERVLDFARTGVDDLEVSDVMLEPLINEIWDGIAPGSSVPSRLTLNLEVERVNSFAICIDSVLHNLLSNAVNYYDPAKGSVDVSVSSFKTEGHIVIEVSDNGVGIARDQHEKIFEMFQHHDARGGDGIGLAIVRKQVAYLQAELRLESSVGEGSRFILSIPQHEEEGMAA